MTKSNYQNSSQGRHASVVFAFAIAFLLVGAANADTLFTGFSTIPGDPYGIPRTNYSGAVGDSFTYTGSTAVVTALGVFDASDGTFADDHIINLYTIGGTLLASGTVAAGTGTSGAFVYTNVLTNSVTLTNGAQYVLTANYPVAGSAGNTTDPFYDATVISSSIATNVAGSYSLVYSSGFPDQVATSAIINGFPLAGYIGPNLQVSAIVAPEPNSFILCGLGAVGLFIATRRQRKA